MASNMMQCQNSFFGAQGASLTIEKSLSTHNSFLGQTGYVVANIRDNSATFSIPKGYNCFDAYFITDTTAIKRTYLLPNKTPTKKLSLTHIGTPESDEKTGLTISR